MLAQAIRAEGIRKLPDNSPEYGGLWDRLLRFSGNKSRAELLTDIGLGKRIASIVAKRLLTLLADNGERPDALLLTRERFTAHDSISQGSVVLDGSENASVQFARCCRPIPGDSIVGYLGRGEGLMVHALDCSVAQKLLHKDSERFIDVEWSDEPLRAFETGAGVTVINGQGVLARVAAAVAASGADITHIKMEVESAHEASDLRFVISVLNLVQLEVALRNLRRTPSVLKAQRAKIT